MEASTIGPFVREQRRLNRLTQQELADLSGVSERFIREFEAGKTTVHLDKGISVPSTLGFVLVPTRHNAEFAALF